MDWPVVLENDDGIRPAGPPDECFYCHQHVGQPHTKDCVCVTKLVKIRYTFEVEVRVPHCWDAHDINFHRNKSSWCSSNALDDIQAYALDCACGCCTARFLEVVEDTPTRSVKETVK